MKLVLVVSASRKSREDGWMEIRWDLQMAPRVVTDSPQAIEVGGDRAGQSQDWP